MVFFYLSDDLYRNGISRDSKIEVKKIMKWPGSSQSIIISRGELRVKSKGFRSSFTKSLGVDSNLLMFFLSGVFGWSGTPAAFQLVTRTLVYELRLRISDALVMYVDDLFGICYRSRVEAEIGFIREYITCLLGSQSVADEKTEIGQRITFIGYDWDLVSRQGRTDKWTYTGFELAGKSTVAFDNHLVLRAKKGGRRSTDEAREARSRLEKLEKFPMTLDKLLGSRESFWKTGLWDTISMDRKAIWLGIAVGLDSGLRISNYTKTEGLQEDHCIRAGQLQFVVSDISGVVVSIPGGEKLRSLLYDESMTGVNVLSVMLPFSSSKTSNNCKGGVLDPIYIGRRAITESNLLDDIVSWIRLSGVLDDEGLFTRYGDNNRQRCLRRKDVNDGIKEISRDYDLDDSHFSSTSVRKGFASAAIECGISERDYNARGGWVQGSQMVQRGVYLGLGILVYTPGTLRSFTTPTKASAANIEITSPEQESILLETISNPIVDNTEIFPKLEGSQQLQEKLRMLITEFQVIFSMEIRGELASIPPMKISVNDSQWYVARNRQPPRIQSTEKQYEVQKQVNAMLKLKVIKPLQAVVYSHWSF
eukprot:gene2729-5375_t